MEVPLIAETNIPRHREEHKAAEREVSIVGDGRYEYDTRACMGSGSFGRVYEGTDLLRPNYKVAIKKQDVYRRSLHAMAIEECEMMAELKGGIGIPKLLWSGMQRESHFIIMEMLGPSLSDLLPLGERYKKGMGFSMKTIARIAVQMISRLEFLHDHGIVHRDVKPNNMLMGRDACCNTLFLTDYGLSKSNDCSDQGPRVNAKPVLLRSKSSITGTVDYCSVNVHQGQVYSRRDDLISLCYSLVYLRTLWLPWIDAQADAKTTMMDKILQRKLSCTADVLCANLPHDFMRFVSACFDMGFAERPNYSRLRSMIYSIARADSFDIDLGPWDWQLPAAMSRMAEEASGNTDVGMEANKIRMTMKWMQGAVDQDYHKARVHQQVEDTQVQRPTAMYENVSQQLSTPPCPRSRRQEKCSDHLVTPVTDGLLKKGSHCAPVSSSQVLPKLSNDKASVSCLPVGSYHLRGWIPGH